MKNKLIGLFILLPIAFAVTLLVIKNLNISNSATNNTSESAASHRQPASVETSGTVENDSIKTSESSSESEAIMDDLDKTLDSLNNGLDDLNL